MRRSATSVAIVVLSVIAGSLASISSATNDGAVPFPKEYKRWPVFLKDVQRPDAEQVRDLYVNPKGATTQPGQPFPRGTIFVMENYKAERNAFGMLQKDINGKLYKGQLAKVFIMAKVGVGTADIPETFKNGEWLYAAYGPDGQPLPEDFNVCRACHLPLASKDFVQRYDEYFEKRGSARN